MGRKKGGVRLSLSLLAIGISVPLASGPSHFGAVSKKRGASGSGIWRADGTPIPPLPPPKEPFLADGTPVPLLPPRKETVGGLKGFSPKFRAEHGEGEKRAMT